MNVFKKGDKKKIKKRKGNMCVEKEKRGRASRKVEKGEKQERGGFEGLLG